MFEVEAAYHVAYDHSQTRTRLRYLPPGQTTRILAKRENSSAPYVRATATRRNDGKTVDVVVETPAGPQIHDLPWCGLQQHLGMYP